MLQQDEKKSTCYDPTRKAKTTTTTATATNDDNDSANNGYNWPIVFSLKSTLGGGISERQPTSLITISIGRY